MFPDEQRVLFTRERIARATPCFTELHFFESAKSPFVVLSFGSNCLTCVLSFLLSMSEDAVLYLKALLRPPTSGNLK